MGAAQGPVTVLVGVASKHGATREIGEILGEKLYRQGIDAVVRDAADVRSLAGYDAAVIGSAVYMGHWMHPAMQLAERFIEEGGGRPLWLFSSGPIGDAPGAEDEPAGIRKLIARPQVRGHRRFAGKLERCKLGPLERLAVRMTHAPEGDFRSWPEVEAWAGELAASLAALTIGRTTGRGAAAAALGGGGGT